MTVKELKNLLKNFNDNEEIVVSHTDYQYGNHYTDELWVGKKLVFQVKDESWDDQDSWEEFF